MRNKTIALVAFWLSRPCAKLQSIMKEMQDQSEDIKELIQKEREAAKEELELARAEKEVSDKEVVDKLTAEIEKLKDLVSSLEQKNDETERKYEESNRLSEEKFKQAHDAELKIAEMKTAMNMLKEKINEMEAEEQIMRHQVMLTPYTRTSRFSFKMKENGQLENVDVLIKASTEDLGFSNGKPVVTFIIYKSLLHWKVFETERTNVFDRLVTVFCSAMQKEEDNNHMAYWLSATSTLLFLLQKTLNSNSGISLHQRKFGRMTQSFRSSPSYFNLEIVRQVDAKYPALLFKQQLTAFVEKSYAIICDNLKKDLSKHLSWCIQAPSKPEGDKSPPSLHWQHITESLNEKLKTLEDNHVPAVLVQKIFTQVFSYINVQIFNSLLLHRECCTFSHGKYVKAWLSELELWCNHVTEKYAGLSWDELKHLKQAVGFLVIHKKSKITYEDLTTHLCPALSVQQIYRICTLYYDDNYPNSPVDNAVLSTFKGHVGSEDSEYFLLEDDPRIPILVDDLMGFLNEKDFAEMKPTCALVENPEFKFLVE